MRVLSGQFGAKLGLLVWLAGLATSLVPQTTAAEANFTYRTHVTYQVHEDGSTDVTEHYQITNNTSRLYLTEIKLSTPTATLNNLAVTYDDGTGVPATTAKQSRNQGDITYDYQQISIVFPRQLYGLDKTWSFDVRYRATGLADIRGGAHTVYVPSVDPTEGTDDYQVTVEVPQSFGTAHFAGAPAASAGLRDGLQFYVFHRDELVQHSLALAFGDVNLYSLNFNFPLANDSPIPRTLTIALPPDLNNQKSYINRLTPAPAGTRLDEDGNVLADYKLAPGQHLTVTTDVTGEVRYRDYDLGKSGKKADISPDLVRKYTGSDRYWQTGGTVAAAAASVSNPNAPVAANVRAMYQYVIDKLNYNKAKIQFNIRQGAAAALAHPNNAVCLEYSDLLVAMLRSQGIPARMPVGYGYSGNLKDSATVADSLHSWVEAYVPGVGWITLDPTWGEKFDEFGHSDLDHFAFSVWGRSDETPTAVMVGGQDKNYQYEKVTLTYTSKVERQASSGAVTAQRYVLLPGVSWDRVTVSAPGQTASDGNAVALGGLNLNFGSLAPAQRLTMNHLVVGDGWNRAVPAQYNQTHDGQTLVLATTQTKLNYAPLGGFVIIIVGGIILLRRRKKSLPQG